MTPADLVTLVMGIFLGVILCEIADSWEDKPDGNVSP